MSDDRQQLQGAQFTGLPRVDGLVSRLIESSDDQQKLTLTRTVDTRTALARGLAEYFGQLERVAEGGRALRFRNVQVTWAEPETPSESPALTVTATTPATYEDADFTPRVVFHSGAGSLREIGACSQDFLVTVWSTDPMQRLGLCIAIEDAADPVEWMSGFRLELPYYFGARATFLVQNVFYQDSAAEAQRRWRPAVYQVHGSVPKYIPIGTPPTLIPEVGLEVT
jgi:hypothetical protein